jgi:hypothetical protein
MSYGFNPHKKMNFILNLWARYKNWRWERKCIKHFGCKPETVYVSQEAYDELVRRINEPPDPKTVESLRKLLERKAPWDEEN